MSRRKTSINLGLSGRIERKSRGPGEYLKDDEVELHRLLNRIHLKPSQISLTSSPRDCLAFPFWLVG
jgi:hypothetical protein